MRSQIVTTVTLLLVLSWPATAAEALAQDPSRGTTLVCYAGGGDGPTLEEWAQEQVAEYEAQFGHDVAGILAHPETGNCLDPAGLFVGDGWGPGTSWLCSRDSEGRWIGPGWIWSVYQRGDEQAPDPTTGRCPQPWSPVQSALTELGRAAATAVHMTELEVAADYDRLYGWMHPDSQAIVPQEAMEGWYREVFAVRPPIWMTIDDVRLVEWTWDVTGKVYPSAAEVSFRQRFADGEETDGVIRLVRDNGVWRWFFGRDRPFVEEQIARFET